MKFMKQLLLPWWPLKLTLFCTFVVLLDLTIGLMPITSPEDIFQSQLMLSVVKDDKPKPSRATIRIDSVISNRNGGTPIVVPLDKSRLSAIVGTPVLVRGYSAPATLLFPGHDIAISIRQNDQWVLEERESTTHYQSVFVRWSIYTALVGACFLITLAIEFVAIRRSQSRI